MGVKLQDLFIRRKINFSELKGRIIAIDAPNIIMSLIKFTPKNTMVNDTDFILDRTQRPISHLYGLLYRTNFYFSKSILPIFCFDGRVSELKRKITKNQLNDFRFAQNRYKNAINSENNRLARKIALSSEYLWPNIVSESKKLLNALGIPTIEAPASAESQCAYLVKNGIADYSNSQDFDSLVFGCPFLIQNLSKSLRRKVHGRWTYKKIDPLLIDLKNNLNRLEINQFQLVDLVLLLKTDYFSGIKGIGPKTALKLIKKHKSIETIIRKERNEFDFSAINPDLIAEIRKLYLLPEVLNSFDNMMWNPPDRNRILYLMCNEHNLNNDRVKSNINKVIENFYKTLKHFQYILKQPKSVQKTLDNILS